MLAMGQVFGERRWKPAARKDPRDWMGGLCDTRINEDSVLSKLQALAVRGQANLVTMSQLCQVLDAAPSDLEGVVRNLEQRGMLLCVPAAGPVAVISIIDGPLIPREPA
jgi:hypothetical protein